MEDEKMGEEEELGHGWKEAEEETGVGTDVGVGEGLGCTDDDSGTKDDDATGEEKLSDD